ncbi:MAG: 4Fe-4S dicluster domain-containing protein [Calditrichaeota bacterium]|nr:4Fe-4S dicluster domain-containing protein [Calditrichota bacterium]
MSNQTAGSIRRDGHEEGEQRTQDSRTTRNQEGGIAIVIHRHLCKGCEICAEVCPKDVLQMIVTPDRWEGLMVEVVDMEACNACMLCELECPDFAIEVHNLKKQAKAVEKSTVG